MTQHTPLQQPRHASNPACRDPDAPAPRDHRLLTLGEREQVEHLYQTALFMYRQIGARRGEAECLIILSRLHALGSHEKGSDNFDSAAEQQRAVYILVSMGLEDQADKASRDISIDELINSGYDLPGEQEYRPEHRRL